MKTPIQNIAQPTPGPWSIYECDAHGLCTISKKPGGTSFQIVATMSNRDDQSNADARLIAAAPDLLAALERVIPWIGKLIADKGHLNSVCPNDAIGALQQAEACIARATGVQS